MTATPARLRRLMNLWPTFRCAGIRVVHIADDWSSATVRLKLGVLNRNAFGTAFGGSLSAMTDPFFALLALHQLGRGYIVWDKAAEIEFVSPGRGTLTSTMTLPPEEAEQIRAATKNGDKFLKWYDTTIVDADGRLVARVRRQVYVRRRKRADA
ncbi:DUF4442 domain-containing protein [Thermobifida halotolerans]|uniref:DUF4442 domain-containing protein n=2 Tax=Thermobifida halotolerans TaxID=483545 RepID=A0A399G1N9_9ACTN|nr:DUF4442 domain-containing protein [Thermobifida halotolerans]